LSKLFLFVFFSEKFRNRIAILVPDLWILLIATRKKGCLAFMPVLGSRLPIIFIMVVLRKGDCHNNILAAKLHVICQLVAYLNCYANQLITKSIFAVSSTNPLMFRKGCKLLSLNLLMQQKWYL